MAKFVEIIYQGTNGEIVELVNTDIIEYVLVDNSDFKAIIRFTSNSSKSSATIKLTISYELFKEKLTQ